MDWRGTQNKAKYIEVVVCGFISPLAIEVIVPGSGSCLYACTRLSPPCHALSSQSQSPLSFSLRNRAQLFPSHYAHTIPHPHPPTHVHTLARQEVRDRREIGGDALEPAALPLGRLRTVLAGGQLLVGPVLRLLVELELGDLARAGDGDVGAAVCVGRVGMGA